MTALKPIENRNVRAVASETYPSNTVCAHPECNEPVQLRPDGTPTVHHIFPRGFIKSDSYFVAIGDDDDPIPHAVGLCGSGTTGHHGDVEEHRAWIKYEDGEFVWYDRVNRADGEWRVAPDNQRHEPEWGMVGPLNPQPGSREGKPKRRKFKGEARRKRRVISIRVPQDDIEDGAGIFDDLVEQATAKLRKQLEIEYNPTTYKLLAAVLYKYITD